MTGEDKYRNSLIKIADNINKKRRNDLLQIYASKNEFTDIIKQARESGKYEKGNKSKSMRKVAWVPLEVDEFFTKMYGKDYYKDKDFFKKYAPEWAVIDPLKQ